MSFAKESFKRAVIQIKLNEHHLLLNKNWKRFAFASICILKTNGIGFLLFVCVVNVDLFPCALQHNFQWNFYLKSVVQMCFMWITLSKWTHCPFATPFYCNGIKVIWNIFRIDIYRENNQSNKRDSYFCLLKRLARSASIGEASLVHSKK